MDVPGPSKKNNLSDDEYNSDEFSLVGIEESFK